MTLKSCQNPTSEAHVMSRIPQTTALVLLLALPLHRTEAQELPPEDPKPGAGQEEPTLNDKAETAYVSGQFANTIRLSDQRLEAAPNDHVALYLRASARIEVGRAARNREQVRAGIADARKAIELGGATNTKYYLPYLYGMSTLAEVENKPEHAKTAAKTANQLINVEQNKDIKANLLYQRARINVALRKYSNAELDFRQAITANNLIGAWSGLAEMYMNTKRPNRARETFDEAIRSFPNNPMLLNNRGLFLQRTGQGALALPDFTSAIKLNPGFTAAYINRGYAQLAMNDPAAAELDFSAALGLQPDQPTALRLRAGCHLLQKRAPLAIDDLQAAMKLAPNTATQIDLGFANLINLQFKASAELLDEAQKADPALRHIQPWRYAAMIGAKQADDARRQYAASLARVKTNAADTAWADWIVAILAGDIQEPRFLAAANVDPAKRLGRTTEAYFFLGLRSEIEGDLKTAAAHYRKSIATKRADLAAYRGALIGLDRTSRAK